MSTTLKDGCKLFINKKYNNNPVTLFLNELLIPVYF